MGDYAGKLTTPDWITAAPDAGKELMVGEEGGAGDVINRPAKTNFASIQKLVDGAIGANLLKNGDFELWSAGTAVAPSGWILAGGGSVARDTTKKRNNYSAKITYSGSDTYIYHAYPDYVYFQGAYVTLGVWVKCSTASITRLYVNDGVGATASDYHTGGGAWELITVTRQIDAAATKLWLELHVEGTGVAYFDAAKAEEGQIATAFCNASPEWGQVVQEKVFFSGSYDAGGTGTIPFDDTIPQNTEGNQFLSINFVPKEVNNALIVEVNAYLWTDTAGQNIVGAIFQDSAANAIAAGNIQTASDATTGFILFSIRSNEIIPITTNQITFAFRAGIGGGVGPSISMNTTGGASRIFGGVSASSIKVTEYQR